MVARDRRAGHPEGAAGVVDATAAAAVSARAPGGRALRARTPIPRAVARDRDEEQEQRAALIEEGAAVLAGVTVACPSRPGGTETRGRPRRPIRRAPTGQRHPADDQRGLLLDGQEAIFQRAQALDHRCTRPAADHLQQRHFAGQVQVTARVGGAGRRRDGQLVDVRSQHDDVRSLVRNSAGGLGTRRVDRGDRQSQGALAVARSCLVLSRVDPERRRLGRGGGCQREKQDQHHKRPTPTSPHRASRPPLSPPGQRTSPTSGHRHAARHLR